MGTSYEPLGISAPEGINSDAFFHQMAEVYGDGFVVNELGLIVPNTDIIPEEIYRDIVVSQAFLSIHPDLPIENWFSTLRNYQPENDSQLDALNYIDRLITAKAPKAGVFLWGTPGLGKSHLAVSAAKECMLNGMTTHFVPASRLFRYEKEGVFNNVNPNTLIIVDDLNSPLGVDFSSLKELVFQIHDYGGKLLVTSNQDYQNFLDRGFVVDINDRPRYLDRSKGLFKVIQLWGKSHREESGWLDDT